MWIYDFGHMPGRRTLFNLWWALSHVFNDGSKKTTARGHCIYGAALKTMCRKNKWSSMVLKITYCIRAMFSIGASLYLFQFNLKWHIV